MQRHGRTCPGHDDVDDHLMIFGIAGLGAKATGVINIVMAGTSPAMMLHSSLLRN